MISNFTIRSLYFLALLSLGAALTLSATHTSVDYGGAAPPVADEVCTPISILDGTTSVASDPTVNVSTVLNTDNDITSFVLPEQTGIATISTVDHTVTIEVAVNTDLSNLTPTIGISSGATIDPASGTAQDFSGPVTYTVTAMDGTTEQIWTVTVSAIWEAHINFQSSDVTPPVGYVADFGEEFGDMTSVATINGTDYEYGWINADTNVPWDISENNPNDNQPAGRNRRGTNYGSLPVQAQLEGTLVHFQGDNISSWAGQNRGQEVYWEIEIPNGDYAVTVSLGDFSPNLDSRHSATIEGVTIIPAFVPTAGQIVQETMVVNVSDGLLTMNGLGGFNTKINYIDIVETTMAPDPVTNLSFNPSMISEDIEVGTSTTLSATLVGTGAGTIGLVIDDNVNLVDNNLTGENEWLTLPATPENTSTLDFAADASMLAVGDTRMNKVIATANGFVPAELDLDITVISAPVTPITVPFRMNVGGSDVTIGSDLFAAENTSYLVETQTTQTGTSSYSPNPGNGDLYFPRRFGTDFGYDFPIANGTYEVVLHMVENFASAAGDRVFDVLLEGTLELDDKDLFANPGFGALFLFSQEVTVADGELNIQWIASVNNGIVQAIEICSATAGACTPAALPVTFSDWHGRAFDDRAELHWSTSAERDNRGFYVESSTDGRTFREIGFVPGRGDSEIVNDYAFTDERFSTDTYYRLRQEDFDGSYEFSSLLFLRHPSAGKGRFTLAPNPVAGDRVRLLTTDGKWQDTEIRASLYGVDGRRLATFRGTPDQLSEQLSAALARIKGRLLWLRLQVGNETLQQLPIIRVE